MENKHEDKYRDKGQDRGKRKGNNGDMEVVWSGPSSGLEGCAKPSPTLPSTLSTSEGRNTQQQQNNFDRCNR